MISTRKNNAKSRELLKKELANLSYTQLCEVFNIIRVDTDKFTENNNGVFINLKFISDNTIKKVWDFIEFSKNNVIDDRLNINKDKNIYLSSENSDSFTMGKEDIQLELNRIKNIRNENFSFQNFLDRLSSNNLKSFPNDGVDKIHYPSLKTIKYKFEGTKARLLKKCKDATNNTFENSFTNSLDINYCDEPGDDNIVYNQTEELEEDIEEEEGSDAELEEDEL
jgi:hypothetical protein